MSPAIMMIGAIIVVILWVLYTPLEMLSNFFIERATQLRRWFKHHKEIQNIYRQLKSLPVLSSLISFCEKRWQNPPFRYLGVPTIFLSLVFLVFGVLANILELLTFEFITALSNILGYGILGFVIGLYLGGIPFLVHQRVKSGKEDFQSILPRMIAWSLLGLSLFPLIIVAPYLGIFVHFQSQPQAPATSDDPGFKRGTKLIYPHELQEGLWEEQKNFPRPKYPLLEIGDIQLPNTIENLSFFMVGSPGSGKTQAIKQLLSSMKERDDCRVIVLDRNAELLETFYDENKDYIFNPFDKRSVTWRHAEETDTDYENLAANLIPEAANEDQLIFIHGARALLTDLYRTYDTNQQILRALTRLSPEDLKKEVEGGISAQYFNSPGGKMGGNILAHTASFTRFYKHLDDNDSYFSFTKWAKSNDPGSIFLPIFENQRETLAPLYSLIFDLVMEGLLSRTENDPIQTVVVIDELGALQPLNNLSRLVAEGRKYNTSVIMGTQTEAQITKTYSEQDTEILLQSAKTKLILNCNDASTAERLSKLIGTQDRVDIVRNESHTTGESDTYGKPETLWHMMVGNKTHKTKQTSVTQGVSEQIRENVPVVSSTEIQQFPNCKGILLIQQGYNPTPIEIYPRSYSSYNPKFLPKNE